MGFRVLVVDDELSLSQMVKTVLDDAGFEVRTAGSGEEALSTLRTESAHLVLSDIRMPGMSGLELLGAIKEAWPATEVVLITSHGGMDSAIAAMRKGAYDYLLKPIDDVDVLVPLVQRVQRKIELESENERLVGELRDKHRNSLRSTKQPVA